MSDGDGEVAEPCHEGPERFGVRTVEVVGITAAPAVSSWIGQTSPASINDLAT
jgi:hypothetical protein